MCWNDTDGCSIVQCCWLVSHYKHFFSACTTQKPDDSKDVQLGTVIAVMVDEGDDWQNAQVPAEADSPSAPVSAPSTATGTATTPSVTPSTTTATQQCVIIFRHSLHFPTFFNCVSVYFIVDTIKHANAVVCLFSSHGYGPAVRSLLELYQLKVNDIPATGPHGRVLKGYVDFLASTVESLRTLCTFANCYS